LGAVLGFASFLGIVAVSALLELAKVLKLAEGD